MLRIITNSLLVTCRACKISVSICYTH